MHFSFSHTHIDIGLIEPNLISTFAQFVGSAKNAHSSTVECVMAGRTETESPVQDLLTDLTRSELAITQADCKLHDLSVQP